MSFQEWLSGAEERIHQGSNPYLVEWIFVPVDSEVDGSVLGEFNIEGLQMAGLSGWQIVGVVPRTLGVGLKNTSFGSSFGESWGGGMGGNVSGVYVLLQKKLENLSDPLQIATAERIYEDLSQKGYEI